MINHPKMKHIYVGVDTHRATHTAVVINCFSEKLGEITFENKPKAFKSVLNEINEYCDRGITPVFGLEDTGGSGRALAVFLLKQNVIVKEVNSILSQSERKNQSILNKTDSYDSFCVARVLLNKFDELQNADPMDIYWTLAMLVRRRTSIVKSSTALKNQLHAQIIHHYPSYKKFFTVFDCKTALAFWERYPSPSKLKQATIEEIGALLHENSSGFFDITKAEKILSLVESDGDTTTEFQESRDFMITNCIRELKNNTVEIKKLEKQMKVLMSRLGYKLETMIGVDLVTACGIVAEIGSIKRFSTPDKLAKYSGVSPVNYSSGKTEKKFRNKQGNRILYILIRNIAVRNINCGRNKDKPVNDIFYTYYQKKISEGKTSQQAIICVMRRLINIIYGMMKNKTVYIHPSIN